MMVPVLLNALVPIFAVMALGYFAGWIRDVDNHHVAELNALVMDFALPASLFAATASTSGAGNPVLIICGYRSPNRSSALTGH